GRASARKTHTNWSYNLWSPLATHLYGDIASTGCARTTHTNWSYNLWSPLATHLYGDIASTVQDTIKKRISSGSRYHVYYKCLQSLPFLQRGALWLT
ncbi:MAG: hypothetical protein ACJ8CB_30860, partial [Ktedonobacteraceae bacterium]